VKPRNAGVLALLVLLFPGCQEQRSAGTSTETENAIVARSFPVDSLLPSPGAPSDVPVVATLRLDASRFDFSASRRDAADLDVVDLAGVRLPFEVVRWEPAASEGRLRVRIEPGTRGIGARVVVRAGLPPASRASGAAVWRGIDAAGREAWNSVLVDDFESGNLLHNRLPDSSFWFLGGALPGSGLSPADSGRSGSALHVVCNTGACSPDPVLLAATRLAPAFRDFRSLDSIELWARGSGRLWITLEALDSVQMGRMARGRLDSIQPRRAWAPRSLGASWIRLVVRPTDFEPGDGRFGNVGWSVLGDSLNYLTFLLDGGSELWVDHIRLHGIVADDLR